MTLSQSLVPIVIFWAIIGGLGASLLLPAMQSLIHGNFQGPMQRRADALGRAAAAVPAAGGAPRGGVVTPPPSPRGAPAPGGGGAPRVARRRRRGARPAADR